MAIDFSKINLEVIDINTIPKCRFAEKSCAASIFAKRKRLIVSNTFVSKLSTLFAKERPNGAYNEVKTIKSTPRIYYLPLSVQHESFQIGFVMVL